MDLRLSVLSVLFLVQVWARTAVSEREDFVPENGMITNLTDLANKYQMLCNEMRLISKHVIFLEQALSDLGHHGDVLYRKKRENSIDDHSTVSDSYPEVVDINATTSNPGVASEKTETSTEDDSIIVVRKVLRLPEGPGPFTGWIAEPVPVAVPMPVNSSKSHPSSACGCNLLHDYSCPIDEGKTFDNQFNDWYHNLLFGMSHNCSQAAKEFAKKSNHRSKHRRKHHHRQHRNTRFLHPRERNQVSLSSMNLTQIDEMEQSIVEEDTVYATCDVVPNRHISLILQQNVKGKINLWQRSDGHGPLYAHIHLSGFRVREGGDRKKRETVLLPIETTADSTASPSVFSLEHGFHVHAIGNMTRGCQSTGTHFNPTNSSHGGPMDSIRHAGDLGNIRTDEKGIIDAEYSYPYVSLVGEDSIIGKSLVIHAQADDYGRHTTGNSGPKIACCLIEKVAKLPFLGDSNGTVQSIRGPTKH